jgi:hypothetical protein
VKQLHFQLFYLGHTESSGLKRELKTIGQGMERVNNHTFMAMLLDTAFTEKAIFYA